MLQVVHRGLLVRLMQFYELIARFGQQSPRLSADRAGQPGFVYKVLTQA